MASESDDEKWTDCNGEMVTLSGPVGSEDATIRYMEGMGFHLLSGPTSRSGPNGEARFTAAFVRKVEDEGERPADGAGRAPR